MTTTSNHRTDAEPIEKTPIQSKPFRRVLRPAELGEVESCLESVVVPGELESWANTLLHACRIEGEALHREITGSHTEQLAKLVAEDPNLGARATQIQHEDADILQCWREFEEKVKRLQEASSLAGPREDKLDEGLQTVITNGLALVIRVRKQEKTLSTWFAEALQRDTGVGD